MSMDFEWCPCPRSRLPSQLVHLINRAHVFCETDLKSTQRSSVFIVGLSDLCATLFEHS